VIHFGNSASTQQSFTSNVTLVNNAINALPASPTGQYTNWEAGLAQASSNFPNRSNPNLVIFATDGDPTASSAGSNDTNQPNGHLQPAVIQANTIKNSGTRIMALGIGSPTLSRLQAISGPSANTGNVLTSDVITTNFAELAADLAEFAEQTCGGTITTTKLIDADGNLGTTNDRTPASGWSFDINGGSNPAPVVTLADGKTVAVGVDPASGYSVTETVKDGYEIMTASCSGATNNGAFSGASVTGMTIAANDIVSCVFINKLGPPKLTVVKEVVNDNNGNAVPADFTLTVDGSQVVSGQSYTYEAGVAYAINEVPLAGYKFYSITGHDKCPEVLGGTITMALGDNITCTITNNDIAPVLRILKTVVNDNGGTLEAEDFGIGVAGFSSPVFTLESTNGSMKTYTTASTVDSNKEYTISEANTSGYSEGNWVCTNEAGAQVASGPYDQVKVTLNEGEVVTCAITNDDIAPTLQLIKNVINDNGGGLAPSAWVLIAQAGDDKPIIGSVDPEDDTTVSTEAVPVTAGIFYTLSESGPLGYEASNWECDGGELISGDGAVKLALALGTAVKCTITNDDIAPKVTITKEVENKISKATSSDFTLYIDEREVTSGQSYTDFDAGSYVISEDSELDTHYLSDVDGDCVWEEDGSITLEMKVGETYSCTLVNTEKPDPSILIEKFGPDLAYEGDEVEYIFYVTNDGNLPLTEIDVLDDIAGKAVFLSVKTGNSNDILEVGETWVYGASYTIPEGEQGSVKNIVEVCASVARVVVEDSVVFRSLAALTEGGITMPPLLNSACDTDDHELEVLNPAINVVKEGPADAPAGSTVTYTFTVTNVGDVPLDQISVLDSITGEAEYVSGDEDEDGSLDLDETWIFTDTYDIPAGQTANVVNTVEVCGMDMTLFNYYDDRRVIAFVQDGVPSEDAVLIDEEVLGVQVCAEDTHTLTIPQVLGESIVVTPPAPKVLAQTGNSNIAQALFGLVLIAGAIASARLTQKNSAL
jgi:uncharacterized repeat protein (TIGR01451 family)